MVLEKYQRSTNRIRTRLGLASSTISELRAQSQSPLAATPDGPRGMSSNRRHGGVVVGALTAAPRY